MTQNKARKAAIRARMARTGERYTEAANRLDPQATQIDIEAITESFLRKFNIPQEALSLAMRHSRETTEYPLLGAAAIDRLKVYLDLKDWVALAKARIGRPEFHHDRLALETLRTATESGEVIVPLSATTYMEVERITSLRQRTDLANVISEISGFVTITGRSIATDHQVQTALAARFGGPQPAPLRAFGLAL
jgi:hypothetical protein